MSVKAFCAQQIPGHSLFIRGSKHRLIANYLFLFSFTCLLLSLQPVSVARAAEAALCDLTASDEASLTQAINCVNTGGVGPHTITLTSDILLTQPLPVLTNRAATEVLIEGNGHALDAAGNGRVLSIESVQNLTLHNVTLTGGQTDVNGLSPNGGGLSLVCGEDLDCNWILLNTVVRNNQAAAGGGILYRCDYHGGGTLLVQDSVIRDNDASGAGGGLIYSSDEESGFCSVTLRNTLIEGNRAVEGGAFRILRPRVTIIDSTIRNNIATENGGGILARISDGFIDMTIRNSTISGNRAELNGGGLYIESPDQTFEIQLINSTVSGNTATTGGGGGLYLGETNDSLRIALLNSTVTQNAAAQGAGVHVFHRDSSFEITGTLRLNNSIVADNLGDDCGGELAGGGLFIGERVTSFGHNLDSDGTCLTPAVRQASDIPAGNANLSALSDFGGPTLTHLLRPGSAAIDAGADAVCAADPINGLDQRGVTRPQGGHCDIGAVEVQADQSATFAVTKFTDSNDGVCDADCSLREAIGAANRNPGRDEIHLSSGVYSVTIPTLVDAEGDTIDEDANTIGDLDIADDLLLTGRGAEATIIDGGGADRLLDVLATANVTIEGLTIRHGRVSDMGGGLSNSGTLALNRVHITDNFAASGFSIGHGGGLFNDGVLTVTDSLIANNRAQGGEASYGEGGGIRNDGLLTLVNSSIVDNSTSDDNDTGIGGGLRNAGTALLEGCTIGNNSTSISGEGGGIYNLGELTLTGCTLTQNRALKGAGLANRGGAVTVATTFLTANETYAESGGEGGAIYDTSGPFTITHSTIADNYGASAGGGIVHSSAAPMTIIASTIARNRTDNAGGGIFNNLVGDVQPLHIVNTTIYSNSAGVAGGIAIDGGPVTLLNSTVAGNQATSAGGGIGYAEGVRLINTILAHNWAPTGPDCSMPADSLGNNLIGDPTGCSVTLLPTDLVGDPQLLPFVDDGTPGAGYLPLSSTSPAIDAGDDAICAASPVNGVDQRGITRPQGAHCDIGAYEASAPAFGQLLFVTATSSGKAGDVKFRDEDILAYDVRDSSWSMIFDGSDVGITKDVDAFSFQSNGTLLLSFNGPTTVPGLGPVDDSDIVQFIPTVLGDNTAGTFVWFLRGADVGLTTDSEDIDAIGFTADGHLVVSTIGNFDAANATGRDEDLFELEHATFANPSSGTWRQFFDGSTLGLANEDINGLWIDPAQPELYLTVKDSFAFAGQSIDGNDIFICTLTPAGGCTYRLFWDGDQHGTSAKHLNGIGMGVLPATFDPALQLSTAGQATDTDAAADDDRDDLDLAAENGDRIFLPLIRR